MRVVTKHRNKWYLKIPGGEIQYGVLSHRVRIWFLGRRLI